MIGWRIIKTGIAVSLCIWIAQLLKFEYPFYSAIAAVIAMQATIEGSLKTGLHRMKGTMVGAVTGYVFALVVVNNPWWTGLGLIVTMTILKIMKWQEAMSIASVVFIAISVQLTGKPLDYAVNRILDTALGIIIAYLVNRWVFPPRYHKETEKSFQDARHHVIRLYKTAFRALLDVQVKVELEEIKKLKVHLEEAQAFVALVQKDPSSKKTGEVQFYEKYVNPLIRLDQMRMTVDQMIHLRQVWQFPISSRLHVDLIQVFNRSYSFLSLITDHTDYSAIGDYEETLEILGKVRIRVIKDHEGTYVGPNKQYILELLDWIDKLLEATFGCLKLS
ncbi:MAG TPA: aromatic acid exporter family protein [Desulfosporosinus sp.]|nr:aromatic acid exporter family protein [Desulfosporosinus sp.]